MGLHVHSISLSELIILTGNEGLYYFHLGLADTVHLRDFKNPVAEQLLGSGLISHIRDGEGIRKPLHSKDGNELTQKEVADLLGISQSYISRLEKKIMKRLKKEIVRFE